MKTLIALMILMSSTVSNAYYFDGMTEEELAGYDILVVRKSDKMIIGNMSRAKYKVVRIEEHQDGDNVKFYAGEPPEETMRRKRVVYRYDEGYNTVILHGGKGRAGLDNHMDGSIHTVEERDVTVGGITYCRSVRNKGICGSAFTNQTYTLGLKLDF